MKLYDVIISGAGPAGCSAAIFLAQQGHSVLLLDKAQFPRDKACGDGISASSVAVMDQMGVMEYIDQRIGPLKKYTGIHISSPSGILVDGQLPRIEGLRNHGYVIPRKDLDHCYVSYVKEHTSITFRENTAVTGILLEKKRARGVKSSDGEYWGRVIIGADGPYSPLASQLSLHNTHSTHQGFAVRAYFSGVEGLTDSIEIHYDSSLVPGYGWIFPVGKDRANVGVGVITRFKTKKGIMQMFKKFTRTNRFAAAKLRHAILEPGTLKGWPLPLGSFRGPRGRGNVLLIGDAGSFVDPMNGEGIYYALKGGQYAAQAAARALEGDEMQISEYFDKLWRKEFGFHDFTVGYTMQPFLSNQFFLEKTLALAAKKQSRADLMAGVIGHQLKKINLLKLIL